MAKKKLLDYLNEYVENGKIHAKSTLIGDYKSANFAYKKLNKIFKIAVNSEDKEQFYLEIFENCKCSDTLTWCCLNMLKLGIQKEQAEEKLKEIACDENVHPIFRSNAKLTLQEWDKGNIKPINSK